MFFFLYIFFCLFDEMKKKQMQVYNNQQVPDITNNVSGNMPLQERDTVHQNMIKSIYEEWYVKDPIMTNVGTVNFQKVWNPKNMLMRYTGSDNIEPLSNDNVYESVIE